ncbi:hypothetical protein RBE51_19180 [Pseudomonas taiwanensis]|uniref:hypothetical protein n=1 Tax=Pseudomonas taiwanensis TaxID=470150 RepID=UPI0028DEF84D|nr:hypothetical protein [Pseudomonas taiwanensis]MDT8924914.1 hypothetical protein [Pseudomonas taiwanensis]
MRIPDEIASLIRDQFQAFGQRAVARELIDLMMMSKSPGEIQFQAQELSMAWQVDEALIWDVVGTLTSKGVVEVGQGAVSNVLICVGIKSSAGAVKKRSKRLDMDSVRKKAIEARAVDLKLKDVGPAAITEISRRIPFEDRSIQLSMGFQGWLPTALYGLDGAIFIITPDQRQQLELEHPTVDLQAAFELMYDDLKAERQSRPTVPNAPYWIREWIKKHGANLTRQQDGEAPTLEDMVIEAEY